MLIFASASDKRYTTDTATSFHTQITITPGQGPFTKLQLIGVSASYCSDAGDPPVFSEYTGEIMVAVDRGVHVSNSFHSYNSGTGANNCTRGNIIGVSSFYSGGYIPPVKITELGPGTHELLLTLRGVSSYAVLEAKAGATPYAYETAEAGDIGYTTVRLKLS